MPLPTINVYDPRVGAFVNQPPAQVNGDMLMLNVLIDLRVLQQLLILRSNGVAITEDINKLRLDEANNPV